MERARRAWSSRGNHGDGAPPTRRGDPPGIKARPGGDVRRSPSSRGNHLSMASSSLDLAEKLSSIVDNWSPAVVARLNDYEVKVVKLQGKLVWHRHEDTD